MRCCCYAHTVNNVGKWGLEQETGECSVQFIQFSAYSGQASLSRCVWNETLPARDDLCELPLMTGRQSFQMKLHYENYLFTSPWGPQIHLPTQSVHLDPGKQVLRNRFQQLQSLILQIFSETARWEEIRLRLLGVLGLNLRSILASSVSPDPCTIAKCQFLHL